MKLIMENWKRFMAEQDESMSAYDLGSELRSIQGDTMHPGAADSPPVIRMMDVVNVYGSSIEKAVMALDSLGKSDLAEKLRGQLEKATAFVADGQPRVIYKDEEGGGGKLQSGAEMFYKIFDDAGDALMAAQVNEVDDLEPDEDEYPEDEPPDEDDDGALRPRERDSLQSDVFKAIDNLTPDEEVEIDLD